MTKRLMKSTKRRRRLNRRNSMVRTSWARSFKDSREQLWGRIMIRRSSMMQSMILSRSLTTSQVISFCMIVSMREQSKLSRCMTWWNRCFKTKEKLLRHKLKRLAWWMLKYILMLEMVILVTRSRRRQLQLIPSQSLRKILSRRNWSREPRIWASSLKSHLLMTRLKVDRFWEVLSKLNRKLNHLQIN
jgi:hypothetical protein